jgi:RNA polymerase sigma factor (sigma-70 family)
MSRFIKVDKELVSVSEQVYSEYYKMARRERYLESDIKIGHFEVDCDKRSSTYIPSKEDSIERLIEQGLDFESNISVEDTACDKAMIRVLSGAMAVLDSDEKNLIKAIYYENQTTREIAEQEKVSHVAIVKRHKKILEKLKKYFL